jgi:glucose-6-phosphate dehydrogenase assembly protein OpcA
MEVSVSRIEEDLKNLWKQTASGTESGKEYAITRACVFNLVVYAPGERSHEEVSRIMAEVTLQHPGRILVLLGGSRPDSSELDAWVTAQCHVSAGHRSQVCCEQILIRAEGAGLDRAASLVAPLLVPDLSVFLWWRDTPESNQALLKDLAQNADRIIIDSARTDLRGFRSFLPFMIENFPDYAFSDLNWSRLTSWRLSIAKIFDVPSWRPCFTDLKELQIEFSQPTSIEEDFPLSVLLLLSWMGSRLGWKPISELPLKISGEKAGVEFSFPKGNIAVELRKVDQGQHGITAVVFRSSTISIKVIRSEEGGRLITIVEKEGARRENITRLEDNAEERLIGKELEILGHDTVYEQSLRFLQSLMI